MVALYSGFEADTIDSISVIDLDEHLGRLTVRDLRQLETRVPLDTLKIVVDLAVEIGREGREGKPVGTLFVVGDTRKVMASSHAAGFDPVRGYSRKERNLTIPRCARGSRKSPRWTGRSSSPPTARSRRRRRYIDASADHHAFQGAGRPALGRGRHQPQNQGRGRRRQRIERHGAHLPERRSVLCGSSPSAAP